MKTSLTTSTFGQRLAIAGIALALSACGGDQAPAALPQVDGQAPTVEQVQETTAGPIELVATSTTNAPDPTSAPTTTSSTTSTIAPTTTTTTRPSPPSQPSLVVECATNPPHLRVEFEENAGIELEWVVTAHSHPGGTGLPMHTTELAAGTHVPAAPQTFDIDPNNLQFDVTVSNAVGEEFAAVGVSRFHGCPVANSLAGRVVDHIDCVSGVFQFRPMEGSGIIVNSVVVQKWQGERYELPVRTDGLFRVPDWNGAEEVKAVVSFTDGAGTHEEHINHWCHESPFGFGDYEVCHDEAISIAYPSQWSSAIELYPDAEGMQSCSFFRSGPEDGRTHHHVTLRPLAMSLEEAAETVLPPGPWTVVNTKTIPAGSYIDPVGPTTKNFARVSYELAWTDSPEFIRRKVWLFEIGNKVWRMEANLQGLDAIDGMAASAQFFVQ